MNIEQLEAELNALPDERDIATPRQQDDLWRRKQLLMATIGCIRLNMHTIAAKGPQLAAKKQWRDYLVAWRKQLADRLVKLNPRDPAFDGLRLSIQRIDRGLDFQNDMLPAHLPIDDLMAEVGFVPRDAFARANGDAWFGSLVQVEREIRELQKLHDEARAAIDMSLHSAEVELASSERGFEHARA